MAYYYLILIIDSMLQSNLSLLFDRYSFILMDNGL